jgi:hypothetical protein
MQKILRRIHDVVVLGSFARFRDTIFAPTLSKYSNSSIQIMGKQHHDLIQSDESYLHRRPTGVTDRQPRIAIRWTILLLLALISLACIRVTSRQHVPISMFVDYQDIVPSTKLIWHLCFDEFRCAKLQVPMNHDTTSSPTDNTLPPVEIALIMVCLYPNGCTAKHLMVVSIASRP